MDEPPRKINWGRTFRRAALLFVVVFTGIIGAALLFHPDSRFPSHWNPAAPLVVSDPVTPLTNWKLRQVISDPQACLVALEKQANVISSAPIVSENPNCGAPDAVTIAGVGQSGVNVQTACATALKLAMWEQHSLQPAARQFIGSPVARIFDQGSYNCRQMRTSSGNATRWSTHATAMAIDVRGFEFANADRAILLRDYQGDTKKAAFLKAVRDGGCRWFGTVLGPDYNALHADHFHLQTRGWGTCR